MNGSVTDNSLRTTDNRTWLSVDFDTLEYSEALSLQHALVAARRSGTINHNVLLLLEHPPVFTMGRRGGSENLKVSSEFLEKHEIAVVQIERGGNITYHGPGQLVAYPIIKLSGNDLHRYLHTLLEVVAGVVRTYGLQPVFKNGRPGVWVMAERLPVSALRLKNG